MRPWHFVFASLALAAVVFSFGFLHRETGAESVSGQAWIYSAHARASTPALRVSVRKVAVRHRPDGIPVKRTVLRVGGPQVQSAPTAGRKAAPSPADDEPPVAPGPGPTLDIPAPPEIAMPSVPGADGPDPCETDPPESLDACFDRPTAGSIDACLQYRIDCYG
jgi:hypothetical protein